MDKYTGSIYYLETHPHNTIIHVGITNKTIEKINTILLDLAREDKTVYSMIIKLDSED